MSLYAVALALSMAIPAQASSVIELKDETTIGTGRAPAPAEYPDGWFVDFVDKDDVVDVVGAAGSEFYVKLLKLKSINDRNIMGFLNAEQTNCWPDMRTFGLSQPAEKR